MCSSFTIGESQTRSAGRHLSWIPKDVHVSILIDVEIDREHRFDRGLRAYLGRVASALGVGMEACTIDYDVPVSAYLALDRRLDRFVDRDLALLWDEVHGWSAAIDGLAGGDMIVLAYLGGEGLLPEPATVVRFVTALHDDAHTIGEPIPGLLREPGDHHNLIEQLPLDRSEDPGWPGNGQR
jgi:hypothetical protein